MCANVEELDRTPQTLLCSAEAVLRKQVGGKFIGRSAAGVCYINYDLSFVTEQIERQRQTTFMVFYTLHLLMCYVIWDSSCHASQECCLLISVKQSI